MITIQNHKKLLSLLEDFHTLSGARVGLFDSDGQELVAFPEQSTPYCRALAAQDPSRSTCKACDSMAYQQAILSQDIHIYHCHAGLMEAIVPIKDHGLSYGYLMMGQIRLPQETSVHRAERIRHLTHLGVDLSLAETLYEEVPSLSMEHIRSLAHILQACAGYAWMEDYVKLQNAPLSYRLELFIRDHLDQPMNLNALAATFQICKTTLCTTVKEETGSSVSELIRSIRMEEAKRLLTACCIPVTEVAGRTGFDDYSYFSKVFKQETGQTPSAYRQMHKERSS